MSSLRPRYLEFNIAGHNIVIYHEFIKRVAKAQDATDRLGIRTRIGPKDLQYEIRARKHRMELLGQKEEKPVPHCETKPSDESCSSRTPRSRRQLAKPYDPTTPTSSFKSEEEKPITESPPNFLEFNVAGKQIVIYPRLIEEVGKAADLYEKTGVIRKICPRDLKYEQRARERAIAQDRLNRSMAEPHLLGQQQASDLATSSMADPTPAEQLPTEHERSYLEGVSDLLDFMMADHAPAEPHPADLDGPNHEQAPDLVTISVSDPVPAEQLTDEHDGSNLVQDSEVLNSILSTEINGNPTNGQASSGRFSVCNPTSTPQTPQNGEHTFQSMRKAWTSVGRKKKLIKKRSNKRKHDDIVAPSDSDAEMEEERLQGKQRAASWIVENLIDAPPAKKARTEQETEEFANLEPSFDNIRDVMVVCYGEDCKDLESIDFNNWTLSRPTKRVCENCDGRWFKVVKFLPHNAQVWRPGLMCWRFGCGVVEEPLWSESSVGTLYGAPSKMEIQFGPEMVWNSMEGKCDANEDTVRTVKNYLVDLDKWRCGPFSGMTGEASIYTLIPGEEQLVSVAGRVPSG